MGKEVESIAVERNHEIILKANDAEDIEQEILTTADVAIEFTSPDNAVGNINRCFDVNLPIVVGTTGWMGDLESVKIACIEQGQALLYASNFSIGVNILFEVNEKLAQLMNAQPMYEVAMEEIHHTEKKDAPSGTAISLANGITNNMDRKSGWTLEDDAKDHEIKIKASREADVAGTHTVRYSSEIDEIELKHTARGRKGFAMGAVLAAEWLQGRTGVFTMKDLMTL
jgi:4-hydroxy-tetrahydrodipicolinate reductase